MSVGLTFTSTLQQFGRATVLWPLWWYSKGLMWMVEIVKRLTVYTSRQLAVGVWVKNLFVPMFGLHDWQSRIISVFMRALQILIRGFAMVLWVAFVLFLACIYVVAPVLAIGFLVFHLAAFF